MKRMLVVQFFFFSSRRRHTRLQGDWSSDVCSSDLYGFALWRSAKMALFTVFGTSSNGKTADSGSAYRGSNPCVPANSDLSTGSLSQGGDPSPMSIFLFATAAKQ